MVDIAWNCTYAYKILQYAIHES